MRLKRATVVTFLGAWGVLFFGVETSAFAAGSGAHGASLTYLIPYWVNFLLYVGILFYLLKKPLSAAWAARAEAIEQLAVKGARELEDAQRRLQDARTKIAQVGAESEALKNQIHHEAEAEVNDIIREARERAERIQAQGKDLAFAERRAMERALQAEMVERVMARAEALVKQNLTVEKDAPLRTAAAAKMSDIVH